MVSTNSIVLHSRRYGDTSRIVVLFTEELGKVSVVARGARTPKSTFGSALEPLTVGRVGIYHRRNKELHTLGTADALGTWKNMHSSLEHLEAGLSLCKLVLRTQPDEVPAKEVFTLLAHELQQMESESADGVYRISVQARISLASLMGFGLQLPEARSEVVWLNMDNGDHTLNNGYRISKAAYSVLAHAPYHHAVVPAEDRLEVEAFFAHYFAHHLGVRV